MTISRAKRGRICLHPWRERHKAKRMRLGWAFWRGRGWRWSHHCEVCCLVDAYELIGHPHWQALEFARSAADPANWIAVDENPFTPRNDRPDLIPWEDETP